MFSPQKNAGDGRSKDGSTKSRKFGCFICRGKHLQRSCPQLKLGKSIVCWRCRRSDHLVSNCTKSRKNKLGGSGGKVSSSTAKGSQGELQEVEAAVRRTSSRTGSDTGSRGVHSSITTGRVARGKSGQRGPGCHQALHSTGGGCLCACSPDGGRPLQDSQPGRGAQAKGAALAQRGAPGALSQGEQGRQPAANSNSSGGANSAVTERRRWARPPASAEPPGRQ